MPYFKGAKGFTLIEIIAAIIIIGILSAVFISRVTSTAETDRMAKADALKSHLRYAQMRAINMSPDPANAASGCKAAFGMNISANSYFMFKDCKVDSKVTLPGANDPIVSVPGMGLASQVVTFDNWGRPCTDLLGTTLADADINLGQSIIITKNTGFVE